VRRFAGPAAHAEQLDHLRLAHLTDLHVGRVTPMAVQHEAVRLTNAAEPDLVVITGDFVCHSQLYLDALTEVVSRFDAPVVCSLGNHDYWSGAGEVRRALDRAGALVLDNAHTVLEIRHQRLSVVGLDDAYTGHADRERALRGLRKDLPAIALSHIGEEADGLWDGGVPLVLSGHTHAGQVTLARLHELAVGRIAGHRYVHGLYGSRDPRSVASPRPPQGALYVGAGIGAAVVPLRLGDRGRREVALFELGITPGSFEEHHDEQPALLGRKPKESKLYARAAAVVKKHQKREKRHARRARRLARRADAE
jgi:predicted MPP superfamily phosphohydrolase